MNLSMDTEEFIRWALADTRTLEERYTVELMVEQGVNQWKLTRKMDTGYNFDERMERQRQRAFNPAYEPRYTEEDVRRTAEMLPGFTSWNVYLGHDDRPIRDLTAFGFLKNLETLDLHGLEVADVAVLAELPALRSLKLSSRTCEDFRPLARCTGLRVLELLFWRPHSKPATLWPDLSGLERLTQLEALVLEGNLLVFKSSITWPRVRKATLRCQPLDARNVRDLPQLPACEFLTLGGVERLDGIAAFPRLRNLTVETVVRDFAPLEALHELTCFTHKEFEPLDIAPLARLPRLQVLTFDTKFRARVVPVRPRDFSPLTDAPLLRELHVEGCPPVEAEVAAINAALPPWDDLLLAEQPRPQPPLRMIIAPWKHHPQRAEVIPETGDSALPDDGLRECESKWRVRFVADLISKKLGTRDWGTTTGNSESNNFFITISDFNVVDKLPVIVEALREALSRLRHDYGATLMIALRKPAKKLTKAQQKLQDRIEAEREDAEYEQRQQERADYLERLHRHELKKQAGEKIDPNEFVPPAQAPLPEDEAAEESDADQTEGQDLADDDPWVDDDDHPLADNYRLMGQLSLAEIWFDNHTRALAVYLMGRQPDQIIPEDPVQE